MFMQFPSKGEKLKKSILEPSKTTLPLKFLNCISHSTVSTLEGTRKSWLNAQGLEEIQNIKPQA